MIGKTPKPIILVVVLLVVFSTSQELDLANPPKLPMFVGKGYDILLGNPLSTDGVDPGFRHEIFQFTYNKNQTTEDGKFILPDGLPHKKTTSCSFSTHINQYRGTTSYQNELKTKAQIGGSYKGLIFKASFSISTAYERIHNETTSQNMSYTQAMAECHCYEMSIDIFKPLPISANFWEGVKYSMNAKSWDRFIEQFGTHYVYDLIVGGRAIQEIQYCAQSVSEMETMKIDLDLAAKASFAFYHGDTSFDFHKYQTEINYSSNLCKTKREIYIGGHPPKTGRIQDWQEEVIKDPMPITYKVLPLSDLFHFNPNKTMDMNLAQQQFLKALDHYCGERGCKEPGPDKPKPQPAIIQMAKSRQHGGSGGNGFDWQHVNPMINSNRTIDMIQLELFDGVSTVVSPKFGLLNGGTEHAWQVPNGEHISQVQWKFGELIDSLTFITNKGTRSPTFGGSGGSHYDMEILPADYRIVGAYGSAGSSVDKLGFILAKTVYHNGGPMTITKNLVVNDE